uniref:RING-type domain-containing protein n=1 Tax=Oryza nivara TaxID=4536 RepID=A0A0E0GT64_ORYNI
MALHATSSRDSVRAAAEGEPEWAGDASRRPAAFYSAVFAQIEEVGWERLVSGKGDGGVSCLVFRILDDQGRNHLLEITLPMNYPSSPPCLVADVPYLPELQWSKGSRLKDVVCQFQESYELLIHVQPVLSCYIVWCDLAHCTQLAPEDIARLLVMIAIFYYMLMRESPDHYQSKFNFITDSQYFKHIIVDGQFFSGSADKKFHENLSTVLDFALPPPPSVNIEDDEQVDCGICYAKHLPIDDELGTHSGGTTDYTCENPSCSRAFHSVCLRDWLRAITTTRQSFDVLFGNCPYCSDPVASSLETSSMERHEVFAVRF